MAKLNWFRILGGGVVAALIMFITDGLLHERIIGGDWKWVYEQLGTAPVEHNSIGVVYFAIFELGRGVISIFLYSVMRPHFGKGPVTAALAGVVAWFAFSVTGPAQFIPLGFYSNSLWLKVAAFQLLTTILAAIAGAALYKDAAVYSGV